MSLIDHKTALAALTLAGLAMPVAAAAGPVIIRSNAAKTYPMGKVLADNARITLQAGESVTILDGKGTRVLSGPGNFSAVVGGGAAQQTRVRNILGNSGTRVARTGAVRGTAPGSAPKSSASGSSLWQADITKSGTICIANPASFSVWRPTQPKAGAYTIKNMGTGKSATITFPPARGQTLWPVAELPVADGTTYRVSAPELAAPVEVKLAILSAAPKDLSEAALALQARGCTAQLDLLIDLAKVADDKPAAG